MQEEEDFVACSSAGSTVGSRSADGALGYLQEVYNDLRQPTHLRTKAAVEALPYEKPRLAVTAMVTGHDFAAMLDRAIERSGQRSAMKLIEHLDPE